MTAVDCISTLISVHHGWLGQLSTKVGKHNIWHDIGWDRGGLYILSLLHGNGSCSSPRIQEAGGDDSQCDHLWEKHDGLTCKVHGGIGIGVSVSVSVDVDVDISLKK